MKIAICFSGQVRTAVESSPNILKFIGDLLPDCDFFIHTWDINTYRPPLNLRILPPIPTKVSKEEINQYFEIYKPKNIIVENFELYWKRINTENGITGDLVPLWHSFYYSIQLKKMYEEINQFKYDIVIKLRPDCIFPPDRRLIDDIDEVLINPKKSFSIKDKKIYSIKQDDIYFMSTSNIMNISAEFYFKGKLYGDHSWLIVKFIEYLKTKNIETLPFQDVRSTIFRQEFRYLDPIKQFYHLNVINSFIYEDINYAKDYLISTYHNLKNPNWGEESEKNLRILFDSTSVDKYFNLI